jgi:hypothetical protein
MASIDFEKAGVLVRLFDKRVTERCHKASSARVDRIRCRCRGDLNDPIRTRLCGARGEKQCGKRQWG